MGSTRLSEGGIEGWKHPVLDLSQGGCGPSRTHGADQAERLSRDLEPPPPSFVCQRWEKESGREKVTERRERKTETGVKEK